MLANLASLNDLYGSGSSLVLQPAPNLALVNLRRGRVIENSGGHVVIDFDTLENKANRGQLNVGQGNYRGGAVDIHGGSVINSGRRSGINVGLLQLQDIKIDNLNSNSNGGGNRVGTNNGGDIEVKNFSASG